MSGISPGLSRAAGRSSAEVRLVHGESLRGAGQQCGWRSRLWQAEWRRCGGQACCRANVKLWRRNRMTRRRQPLTMVVSYLTDLCILCEDVVGRRVLARRLPPRRHSARWPSRATRSSVARQNRPKVATQSLRPQIRRRPRPRCQSLAVRCVDPVPGSDRHTVGLTRCCVSAILWRPRDQSATAAPGMTGKRCPPAR